MQTVPDDTQSQCRAHGRYMAVGMGTAAGGREFLTFLVNLDNANLYICSDHSSTVTWQRHTLTLPISPHVPTGTMHEEAAIARSRQAKTLHITTIHMHPSQRAKKRVKRHRNACNTPITCGIANSTSRFDLVSLTSPRCPRIRVNWNGRRRRSDSNRAG